MSSVSPRTIPVPQVRVGEVNATFDRQNIAVNNRRSHFQIGGQGLNVTTTFNQYYKNPNANHGRNTSQLLQNTLNMKTSHVNIGKIKQDSDKLIGGKFGNTISRNQLQLQRNGNNKSALDMQSGVSPQKEKAYFTDINTMRDELSKCHWAIGSSYPQRHISQNQASYKNLIPLKNQMMTKQYVQTIKEKVGASHVFLQGGEMPIDQGKRYESMNQQMMKDINNQSQIKQTTTNNNRKEIGATHFTLGKAPNSYLTTNNTQFVPLVQQYDSQVRKDRLMENMATNFDNAQSSVPNIDHLKRNDYNGQRFPQHVIEQDQLERAKLIKNLKSVHFLLGQHEPVDSSTNQTYGTTANQINPHPKPPISNTFKTTFDIGKDNLLYFDQRSKSVSRNYGIQSSLASNTERINNRLKLNGSNINLKVDSSTSILDDSVTKTDYRNNFDSSRSLNKVDKSYIGFIKQHNWNYQDAAPVNSGKAKTEVQDAYYHKSGSPNRLSPDRIHDLTGTHFEHGNQKLKQDLISSHKSTYQIPNKSNDRINDGNIAYQQRHNFRILGESKLGDYQTVNNRNFTWLQPQFNNSQKKSN